MNSSKQTKCPVKKNTIVSKETCMHYNNVHDIEKINVHIGKIGTEIMRITLIVKQRNIKDINKNFQATLTNYFLECYVCKLLLKNMGFQYKREVKKQVEKVLKQNPNESSQSINQSACLKEPQLNLLKPSSQKNLDNDENIDNQDASGIEKQGDNKKVAKYVRLIKAYEEKIVIYKLEDQYISTLIEKINEDVNCYTKDSQKYVTQYQKKLCALLILQHFLQGRCGIIFKSFCELWNSVFLNLPLYYFARENNIFYNKVKRGEESEDHCLSNIQELQNIDFINLENDCENDNTKIQFNKQQMKKLKQQDRSFKKVASFREISQESPNLIFDYDQMSQLFYQKVATTKKISKSNDISYKSESVKQEISENQRTHHVPFEISVNNHSKSQKQDKTKINQKRTTQKRDLQLNQTQPQNNQHKQNKNKCSSDFNNKEEYIESQDRSLSILGQDFRQTTQTNNCSQTNQYSQFSVSVYKEEIQKKQAKYRFI